MAAVIQQQGTLLDPILSELKALSSREAYKASWLRWQAAGGPVERKALVRAKGEQLRAVRDNLQAQQYAPATIKRCFIVAQRVWNSLEETEGLLSPFKRVRVTVGDNQPHWNVLEPGELKKLSEALNHGKHKDPLARAVVLTLGLQGWRSHVLCELTWASVKQTETGFYAEFKSKRGGIRRHRIHKEVMGAVEQLGTPVSPNEPLISRNDRKNLTHNDVYRIVVGSVKRVLNKKVTPHGLRATFISTVIAQKGDIALASQLAGHSSVKMTERYMRWQLTGTQDDEVTL